ncbi:hypothetical protein DPM19_23645 [Actinomadura craniellae]|uniref:Methyltransferase small domain-containing protein n=1 Tax=Actinomadura craniellae TaxID=2231787 RepID=A0A365H0N8_9ACTN|nr:methyltransferase [Actinomadura craniellae]RAY12598.1 hypothetical protein DPM19_23645 [Actinomadura craniellae]
MHNLGYAMALEAYDQVTRRTDHQATFTQLDLEWDQLDDVLGGDYNQAAGLFASWLPYPAGGRFLEMGSGCGVASVLAALRGCASVTALDINPAAVRNTAMNARRHGVADRVRALRSDLFGALGDDETFDLVYWNSPFIEAPAERPMDSIVEYHFFDPGYAMHREFFRTVPRHLTDTGRLFFGFSKAMGNAGLLEDLGRQAGLRCRVHRQECFAAPPDELGSDPALAGYADDTGMVQLDFTLLEFDRAR